MAPKPALIFQVLGAFMGLVIIAIAARRTEPQSGLAIALFCTPLFSPYFYDYDLVLYAPGFALLLPLLDKTGHRWVSLPLMVLAWIAGGTGMLQNTRGAAEDLVPGLSVAGLAATALAVAVAVILVPRSRQLA